MDLYTVSEKYVSYLRRFEPKKILSNSEQKNNRKFIGLIIKKGKYNYVVPLSSPKYNKDFAIKGYSGKTLPLDFSTKKYKKDIILLRDTSEPVVFMYSKDSSGIDFYSKIQCNNMIPVPKCELTKIDISLEKDIAYKMLLQKEINFIRKNETKIIKKHINPVYNNRINNRMNIGYVRLATPDFLLLEQKCDEWEKIHQWIFLVEPREVNKESSIFITA